MAAKEKIDVQGYLAKHKVAALFEDLMAKVIKQLPNDPVEFVIRKLQVLHQKQKKTSVASISPVKAAPPSSKIQVTGTSVASKPSKLPISDHLSKSTSGLRPIKSKSAGQPSATLSKTAPTRGSQTTPLRGFQTTPTRESARPATSGGKIGKSTAVKPKPTSSIPRPHSGTRAAVARPSTAPDPLRTKSSQLPVKSTSKNSPGIHKKRLPPSSPASSSSPRTPAKPTPIKQVPKKGDKAGPKLSRDTVKGERGGGEVGVVKEADEFQIDEFFGEGKKSSKKTYFLTDEEGEDVNVGGVYVSDEDDQDEGHVADFHGYESVKDILIEKKRKNGSRHAQLKDRHQTLQDLLEVEDKEQGESSLSMGYHDSSDTSSDGEIWLEDEEALRDEGVVVASGARAVPRHSMSTTVSESLLCARCSRALIDASSASSAPDSSLPPSSEFESASQVAGQVAFPQWTNEGDQSVVGSDVTSSSQLTLRTEDTWGGLAPTAVPQLHSDEESEVHIPVAAPLKSHAWSTKDTPPQTDPYGWGQQS